MSAPPSQISLARYRAEVLVAVRARGLIVAHEGGQRLLGWSEGVDGPRSLADVFGERDLGAIEAALVATTGGSPTVLDGPIAVRRGDVGTAPMQVEVVAATDEPGLDGWVLRLRPARDRHRSFGAADHLGSWGAAALAHRFRSLTEAVGAGILIGDSVGHVDYANPAARELLWRTDEELRGTGWLLTVHPDHRDGLAAVTERVRTGGTSEQTEFRVDVVGIDRWIHARINAVTSDTGRPDGWVAVLSDITDERATADELSRQATHDPLTGLPNRALLEDRIGQAVARAHRNRVPLAVMFVDLNSFKAINDEHGHRTGDQVLREVATRIRTVIRADDTAARLGGDEFVVVAEGVTIEVAQQVATRIGEAIAAPIRLGPLDLALSCAVGIAWVATGDPDTATLIERADRAMYEAKRAGHRLAFAPDR